MIKSLTWRGIVYAVLILVALFLLIPSVSTDLPPWWPKFLQEKKLSLGLDLQGGVHLLLDVKVDKAVESDIERIADNLPDDLRKKHIRYQELTAKDTTGIDITLMRKEDEKAFKELIERDYIDFDLQPGSFKENGTAFQLILRDQAKTKIKKLAHEQALETIRNRVDALGVREADIRRQKDTQILIQLPGLKDPQKAIDLIGKTALLEFKLVDEENMALGNWQNELPAGDEILYETEINDKGERTKRPWLLKRRAVLTGQYLKDAGQTISHQTNRAVVSLSFDAQGARKFEQITEENQGKRLAIVLDDVVYSAPNIQEKISGGNAVITGNFTDQEAQELAIVLRAGALPAPVAVMEKRLVGPSLGKDSIQKGVNAGMIASLIVIAFMLIYYRLSGIFANVAMALNILFILACMAVLGATLTLPGIAGIVLTIGMSVDANVLIFERIREELRFGKTALAASQAGFDKATITIFDANLTTLITAIVLYQFGTGPVKGFAVTLAFGLVANFVTAVFMTKIIYDYLYGYLRWQKISI